MPNGLAKEIYRSALARIESRKRPICSTYRLQLHSKFTFRDATRLIPYLATLGISHVYASPYFKAKAGSTHGYDVVDHCRLNPEIGNQADYEDFVLTLKSHGMHHILDMVPNHVGIGNNDNVWWNDVLENGPASIYADYFDINWTGSPSDDLNGRVLLPVLGDLYAKELESGKLKIIFDDDGFFVTSNDRRFPLSPRTYPAVLSLAQVRVFDSVIDECEALPDRCDKDVARERHERKEQIKRSLTKILNATPAIDQALAIINGETGNPRSFDRLDALLRHQCFRLAHWRTATDEINYRRFFDINDLAGLAMEREEVFDATHQLVLSLLAEDKVAGLRIDHPDGLRDPKQYFERLQAKYVEAVAKQIALERALNWSDLKSKISDLIKLDSPTLYVAIEKILALDEPLIASWPVAGATGYEFLNYVNGMFVDGSAADTFSSIYRAFIEEDTSCEDLIYQKKKLILEISLASELNILAVLLKRIAERDRYGVDFSLSALHEGLKEIIACFPVYRSYITPIEISATDRQQIHRAVAKAQQRNRATSPELFKYIAGVLLDESAQGEALAERRNFAARFQQLTAPATAKGIEDTTFYIYNRLLSLNEVGGQPSRFGISPDELHRFLLDRQQHWPQALSTLTTHDTKRSEDVRARLNVLSEIPDEWHAATARWREMTRAFVNDGAPDLNEQYAIYQTLLGAWPFGKFDQKEFESRIQACMLKSMREAKVHTRWTDPNPDHENAVADFIRKILTDSKAQPFRDDLQRLVKRIMRAGIVNSLAQTLIKLTAPGIPDTYQGTELWDLSLVDPDNRRPVNYELRENLLSTDDIQESPLVQFENGQMKMHLHHVALHLRQRLPELFDRGEYIPLKIEGAGASNIFAFARLRNDRSAITVVPRLTARLQSGPEDWPVGGVWGDTRVMLPGSLRTASYHDLFSGQKTNSMSVADLFSAVPFALLIHD